jgi:hypothetical protein
MAGTPLATLQILIEGDYSNLENSFNEAMEAASEAGGQISQAFNQPDTADQLTTAIISIGTAATDAVAPLQDLGDQAQELGQSGNDVSSLSDAVSAVGSAADDAAPSLTDVSDAASAIGDSEADIQPLGDALAEVADSADNAAPSLTDVSEAASALGDASVDIEPLGEALSAVGDAAEAAAPDMSGVADATSQIGDSADEVTPLGDALDAVSSSAGQAGPALDDTSDSADEVGSSAEEAEGGLSGMAEALLQIGEALAATEALKEFGQEALMAYGTVQSVTIGLTQLTGSADQANEVIEQIKTLAATEPFAFPDIAPTVQRMVALGVSAEQIPGVMQAVANAAAATGNQFNQVANSFDRMALSGTANARQLVQLGISTTDLANAMGVTASQVTTAFKALDQSQRIDALQTALEKFAGSAEAQAQGISGQWQIFQNNFEEVMVAVGAALAPVVSSILQFGSTVMKEITSAIEAFNELPDPIRNTAVAIGLAVAAITPLALGASAVVTAFGSLAAAGEPLVAGLTTLGLVARTTAEAETEEAVAVTAEGAAHEAAAAAIGESAVALEAGGAATAEAAVGAEEAGTAFSAFGLTLGPVAILIGGVAAAIAASNFTGIVSDVQALSQAFLANAENLKVWEDDADSAIYDVNQAMNEGVAAVRTWVSGLTGAAAPLQTLEEYLPTVSQFVKQIAENMTGTNWIPIATASLTLLSGAVAEMNPLMAQALQHAQAIAPAFALVKGAGDSLAASLTNVVAQQAAANTNFAAAKQVLADAATALDAGQISQSTYNRALADYQTALAAVTPKTKDFADSVAGITQAEQLAQEKAQSAIAVYNSVQSAFDDGTASLGTLATAYTKAESAAKAAGDAFATAAGQQALMNKASQDTQAVFNANVQVLQNLETALASGTLSADQQVTAQQQLLDVYKSLQSEATTLGTSFYDPVAAMEALTIQAGNQQTALQNVITTYEGLKNQSIQTAASIEASAAAFKTVQTDAAALGLSVTQVGTGLVFAAANAATATPAINALAQQLTQAATQGLDLVTVNGKLTPTMESLQAAMTATAGAGANANGMISKVVQTADGGTVTVLSFADAHNKLAAGANNAAQGLGNAANAALQIQNPIIAAQNAMTQLTGAANRQVSSTEGVVDAWISLNSTAQTTIQGQLAVQDAFTQAQSALAKMGIQLTATGATTTSTNSAVQALVQQLNDAIATMNATQGPAANAATAITAIGNAAQGAANALSSMDQSMGDAASMSSSAYTLGAMGLNYLKNGELNLATDVPQTLNPQSGSQIDAVNLELERLAEGLNADGTSNNAFITSITAADAAVTTNTTATSSNTAATTSNTSATAAATTATTAAVTATQALQDVNTALGTSFTDTGSALSEVETLIGETGGTVQQSLYALASELNQANAPIQMVAYSSTGASTALASTATASTTATTALTGLVSASSAASLSVGGTNSLYTSAIQANDVLGTLANQGGNVTLTLSGLNADMQSLNQELAAGTITQAQFNSESQALTGYLAEENAAVPVFTGAVGGATVALSQLSSSATAAASASSSAASSTESVAQALATYMQGLESYSNAFSDAGAGASNTSQTNQQALFSNDQSLIAAFTQATGLTLPNQGTAEVKVNPNLTYDPQSGLYSYAVTVAQGLTQNADGTTTQQFTPGAADAGPGTTYSAMGQTIQQAMQAAFNMANNPGNPFGSTALGYGGSGGLSVDSSGYSQGVNYAAYAPNSGNFTPPTPQYSSGNPLPVTITNTQAPQINITIPGATIVGSNGAQQLANVVQQQLITTLRQAGFKL